jgi:hypothetical protein
MGSKPGFRRARAVLFAPVAAERHHRQLARKRAPDLDAAAVGQPRSVSTASKSCWRAVRNASAQVLT